VRLQNAAREKQTGPKKQNLLMLHPPRVGAHETKQPSLPDGCFNY
jgi:hypothetical protein